MMLVSRAKWKTLDLLLSVFPFLHISCHAPVRRPRQVLQETLPLWKNEDVVPFYQILNVKL